MNNLRCAGNALQVYFSFFHLRFEYLTPAQLRERFPQFTPSDDIVALYQKDGGLVDAALGNAAHVQMARGHGAVVIDNCPVLNVETTKDGHSLVRAIPN